MLLLLMVLAAILVQSVVISRIQWPGSAPDLVLVVVVGLALTMSEDRAALLGFTAGLTLDLMPPDVSALGGTALAYTVVAASVARIRDPRGMAWWGRAGVLALAAAASWFVQNGVAWLLADRPFSGWDVPGALISYVAFVVVLGIPVLPALSWLRRVVVGPVMPVRADGTSP